MSRRTLEITEKYTPSGNTYTIVEPTFVDRIDAYAATRKGKNKSGYTLEQVLVGLCLQNINGNPVGDPRRPRDPIAILGDLEVGDVQVLEAVLLNAFTLREEDGDLTRKISKDLRAKVGLRDYDVPSKLMPSGNLSFSFHKPTVGQHAYIKRTFNDDIPVGYTEEEYAFACCITKINGAPVVRPDDSIDLIKDWSLLDMMFGFAIWQQCVNLDNKKYDQASELGKQFREKGNSAQTSSKAKRVDTPPSDS